MNLFEVMKDSFAPYLDGEKPPLHIGEAFNIWTFLAASQETVRTEMVFYNVASDPELRAKLKELRDDVHLSAIQDLQKLLLDAGVPLPKETEMIPDLGPCEASFGTKPTDAQIANLVVFNLNQGITYAAEYLTNTIRADVGYVFMKIMTKKVMFGATFKPLMIKNGWIKVPPEYKK